MPLVYQSKEWRAAHPSRFCLDENGVLRHLLRKRLVRNHDMEPKNGRLLVAPDWFYHGATAVEWRSALFSNVVILSFYRLQKNPCLLTSGVEFASHLPVRDTSQEAHGALRFPFVAKKDPDRTLKYRVRHGWHRDSSANDSNRKCIVPFDASLFQATIPSIPIHVHVHDLAHTKMTRLWPR